MTYSMAAFWGLAILVSTPQLPVLVRSCYPSQTSAPAIFLRPRRRFPLPGILLVPVPVVHRLGHTRSAFRCLAFFGVKMQIHHVSWQGLSV
ncbi:hypothetical protein BKA82DRAFT_522599 [Pisolithus tinctorius]|uniref:Secreted protein n=1 Tax=Pisolithus tinctorius Marx 270 TaxID=870435 RepID=A0A0C3K6Z3_PISTI|nr:hypothetical protein BKA82DRAFT_522599 [Pisolithus tinctorius]KIO05347.1 hypothetical protein M404DRAFT_522599 [Pisolithus tinctorius Marx 270]